MKTVLAFLNLLFFVCCISVTFAQDQQMSQDEKNNEELSRRLMIFPDHFLDQFVALHKTREDEKMFKMVHENLETAKIVWCHLVFESMIKIYPTSEISIYLDNLTKAIAENTNVPSYVLNDDNSFERLPDVVRNPTQLIKAKMYRLNKEGNKAFHDVKFDLAMEKWEEGLNIAEQINDIRARVFFLEAIGYVLALRDRQEEADKYGLKARFLREGPLYKTSDKGELEELGMQSFDYVKLSETEIETCFRYGDIAFESQNYPEALKYWLKCLKLTEKEKNSKVKSYSNACILNIGIVHSVLGQYDKALDYLNRALEISEKQKDPGSIRLALRNLSEVYIGQGEYENALIYLKQALVMARNDKDHDLEGDLMVMMGEVFEQLGQTDKAFQYFKQALDISIDKTGNMFLTERCYQDIGDHFENLKDIPNAIMTYQAAALCALDIEHIKGYSDAFSGVGRLYLEEDYCIWAYHFLKKSLKLKKLIGDAKGEAIDKMHLAILFLKMTQNIKDKKFLIQATLFGQYWDKSMGYNGFFNTLFSSNDKIVEVKDVKAHLKKLTHFLIRQAYDLLLESILFFDETKNLEYLFKSCSLMGRTTDSFFHYNIALKVLEENWGELSERKDQLTFRKNKLFAYDDYIQLLMKRHKEKPKENYDRDAFGIFERKQGRVFLEHMGKSGAVRFAGLPDEIRRREYNLERQLAAAGMALNSIYSRKESRGNVNAIQAQRQKIDRLKIKIKGFRETIKTDYPDYYSLKYPIPVELSEIREDVLNKGEMLLVYNVMKDKTCLWAIGKKIYDFHVINIEEKKLLEKINNYRQNVLNVPGTNERSTIIRSPKPGLDHRRDSYELYRLLFPKDLQQKLSSAETLYIVPTGPLYLLPFESLQTNPDTVASGYLIEDFPIAYLSSASLLKIIRQGKARRKDTAQYPLLAFANPIYRSKSRSVNPKIAYKGDDIQTYMQIIAEDIKYLRELPETGDEAGEIRAILQAPEESNPLQLGKDATRRNVLKMSQKGELNRYRNIIFACHGILPKDKKGAPQSPALILSNPREEGVLTMEDVFSLKLNAQLVSLSACNTGRGDAIKGEGIIGLARAFMFAGTPSISVNLWPVESFSAKLLNVGFFKYLREGKDKAEALRRVKTDMIKGTKGDRYKHPYYWAPLILFGDAQ